MISAPALLISAPALLISTSVLLISAPALLISAPALLISAPVLLISAPALLISITIEYIDTALRKNRSMRVPVEYIDSIDSIAPRTLVMTRQSGRTGIWDRGRDSLVVM